MPPNNDNSLPKLARKMTFFRQACRNNRRHLVKTCMHSRNDAGKLRRGHPRIQYVDNIKKWTRASLEENIRVTGDRTTGHRRGCAAGAANVTTGDAGGGLYLFIYFLVYLKSLLFVCTYLAPLASMHAVVKAARLIAAYPAQYSVTIKLCNNKKRHRVT